MTKEEQNIYFNRKSQKNKENKLEEEEEAPMKEELNELNAEYADDEVLKEAEEKKRMQEYYIHPAGVSIMEV